MLKVLFVCSGNKSGGVGAVVGNQAASLKKADIDVQFFLIKGKGVKGYLINVFTLRKYIINNSFDIIHAHGMSALVATLIFKRPLIVSLLGSEINEYRITRGIMNFLSVNYWSHTIVKSEDMLNKFGNYRKNNISVIPNGVNLSLFEPMKSDDAKDILGWDHSLKQILWMADKNRKSKNYQLAIEATNHICGVELKTISSVESNAVPDYLNAADIVLMTSLWEGSPNLIKEAMACNRPIVATDVGDINWLFGNESGHFITSFDPINVADKLEEALVFSAKNKATNGRKRILMLGLDAETVANKIIQVYKSVLKK